jgi:hypothetical protein
MSIRAEWQEYVADGTLLMLPPFPGDSPLRTVLLFEEVSELLSRPMEEGKEANRRSRLVATLHNIVAGRRLVACMVPFEARKATIGRLDPIEDSIWDIRCLDSPALRVFCRFLEKDVILAVTCRPRSVNVSWLEWLPLGDRNSREWERGKAATKRAWAMLFPAHSPVNGDNLDEYLSNAILE